MLISVNREGEQILPFPSHDNKIIFVLPFVTLPEKSNAIILQGMLVFAALCFVGI